MTDHQNALANLFAACWKDDALKQRFMSDPKAVLAEHGIDVPEDMNVNVVENTDTAVTITMPATPANASELSDHELTTAAGGAGSHQNAHCTGIPTPCTVVARCHQRAE